MSHGQSQRPRADQFQELEPIKYGDIFDFSGELASEPIAPRDAAGMQAAETVGLGHNPNSGPAAVMESAASVNERLIKVGHRDATNVGRGQEVTFSQRIVNADRIIAEAVGGQPAAAFNAIPIDDEYKTIIYDVIGNATKKLPVDKTVTREDAERVISAEVRNKADKSTTPSGVAASMAAAAGLNENIRDATSCFKGRVLCCE